jgi:spore coat protein CotF
MFRFGQIQPGAANNSSKRSWDTLGHNTFATDTPNASDHAADASMERQYKRPSLNPLQNLANVMNQYMNELLQFLKKNNITKLRDHIDEDKAMAIAGYLMSMTRQETLHLSTKSSITQEDKLQGLLHQATSLVSQID